MLLAIDQVDFIWECQKRFNWNRMKKKLLHFLQNYKVKNSVTIFTLMFFLSALLPLQSIAQDDQVKRWHYLGELYMMFPNMKGETAVGIVPEVEVDASSGDILGHLKMGAMFYFEATNDDWAISSDLLYMKLGQDATPGILVESGELTMKQLAWELAGLKRVTPWLDVGLAGRIVSLNVAMDLETINGPRSAAGSKTWFDPVIVVRSNNVIKEKWLTQLRLDAGGFGIGSDFAWQLQANAGYRFSKLFQATVGYRYIGIGYDKGDGTERFLYDIDTYGLVVRLGFNI
jgi:hypothetical protein